MPDALFEQHHGVGTRIFGVSSTFASPWQCVWLWANHSGHGFLIMSHRTETILMSGAKVGVWI